MEHYFKQTDTSVFQNASKEEIEQEFKKFVDQVNGEIENRSEMGSGWNFNGIRELKQQRFWATDVNRKWTFCSIGLWFG